ncbi:MAG: Zn-ribbon domain-containing OB-fold protein [Halioglobus sp.]
MSKILPRETELSAPYWQACREGVLKIQHCGNCQQYQFYPRTICSHCESEDVSWSAVSGAGKIASYSIVRRGISASYEAPYVVALIELNEGVMMMSSIQTKEPESVTVGAAVQVVFEDWGENIKMPLFRLQ